VTLHATWTAFYTIVMKECVRILRIWIQTLVPPSITMTLYFVIFGNLIGSQVGDVQGFSYMEFIVPGLVMMSVIQNSYSNVVSSFFGAKFQKNIEEMMVAPTPASVIILGFVAGGMLRGLLVGVMVTLISLFFTDLQVHNLGILLGTAVLTSALFSLAGLTNAMFAKKFDDISLIPTFVLTPLTYLGGVFYSIQMLPDLWRGVSQANPILYMINAFRFGFLGVSDIPVPGALAMGLAFTALLFGANLYLLRRGYGIRS